MTSLLSLSIPQIDNLRGYDEACADIKRRVKDMTHGKDALSGAHYHRIMLAIEESRKNYYEELQNEKGLCKMNQETNIKHKFSKGQTVFMLSAGSVEEVNIRYEPSEGIYPVIARNGFVFNVEGSDLFGTREAAEIESTRRTRF